MTGPYTVTVLEPCAGELRRLPRSEIDEQIQYLHSHGWVIVHERRSWSERSGVRGCARDTPPLHWWAIYPHASSSRDGMGRYRAWARRPGYSRRTEDRLRDARAWCDANPREGWAEHRVVSLQAFETLEEARAAAEDIVIDSVGTMRDRNGRLYGALQFAEPLDVARHVPAEGGSVSLPDGREITVEQTTYEALADAIGWGDAYRAGTFTDAHALAYFNFEAEHPRCACGERSLDRNHLACAACIERACQECPVLDTVAVRFVKGYPAEKHSQEGRA